MPRGKRILLRALGKEDGDRQAKKPARALFKKNPFFNAASSVKLLSPLLPAPQTFGKKTKFDETSILEELPRETDGALKELSPFISKIRSTLNDSNIEKQQNDQNKETISYELKTKFQTEAATENISPNIAQTSLLDFEALLENSDMIIADSLISDANFDSAPKATVTNERLNNDVSGTINTIVTDENFSSNISTVKNNSVDHSTPKTSKGANVQNIEIHRATHSTPTNSRGSNVATVDFNNVLLFTPTNSSALNESSVQINNGVHSTPKVSSSSTGSTDDINHEDNSTSRTSEANDGPEVPVEIINTNNPEPPPKVNENELSAFLKPKTDGKSVIKFFETNGKLNGPIRKILCDLIIRHQLDADANKVLDTDFFETMTFLIVEAFPTEVAETYYLPSATIGTTKKSPAGKLYNKYTNLCKKYIKHGLRKPLRKKGLDLVLPETTDSVSDEVYDSEKEWLSEMITPWELVVAKWMSTAKKRLQEFCSSNIEISEYINKFPCLKLSEASELFEIDFNVNFSQHKHCLLEVWPHLKKSILAFAQSRMQENPAFSQAIANCELINLDSPSPVEKDITALLLLLHLVPIGTKTCGKRKRSVIDDDGSCQISRASRSELINGFVFHVPVATDLTTSIAERINSYNQRRIRCQAFLVISGDEKKRSFIVYFNGQEYFVKDLKAAIDICFKIFMIFDAEYPPETLFAWTFFQKFIYNISTEHDIRSSSLCTLASELDLL